MLKDFLRRLEELSWKKKAGIIDWKKIDQRSVVQPASPPPVAQNPPPVQPQQPVQKPVSATPTVSTNVAPQQGFAPVAPHVKPTEVDQDEMLRQQRAKQEQDISRSGMGQKMDLRAKMTNWVRQNAKTQTSEVPIEWLDNSDTRNDLRNVIDGLINQDKLQILNPRMSKIVAYLESKKGEDGVQSGSEDNLQQNTVPAQKLDEKDQYLISTFNEQHEDFVRRLRSKVFQDIRDEGIANDVVSRLGTEYLGPPKAQGLQDNRLRMLLNPENLAEFKNIPGFGERLEAEGIDQKISEILKTPTGKQRSAAINGTLSSFLKESSPGAGDSIVDALSQMVTEPELPPALKRFLSGVAINLAKQELGRKLEQDKKGGAAVLDNSVGGPDSTKTRGDNIDAGKAGKIGDMQIGEGEEDILFERLRSIVSNKVEPVKQLSDTVMADFYKYYNEKNIPPSVKVGDVDMSVPDIFQAIASAGTENVKKIIQPGNRKYKQEVFQQIEKNQAEDKGEISSEEDSAAEDESSKNPDELEGYRTVTKKRPTGEESAFSNRSGKIKLNMGGNSLDDMGISLRGLVQSPSIKPYLYQLGLAKEAIFDLARSNANPEVISQRLQQELPKLIQQQQKDLSSLIAKSPKAGIDPATPWGLNLTPDFVKNTLREATVSPGKGIAPHIDPGKAQKLVQRLKNSCNPGDKTATNAVGSMKHQWTKLYPFVFKTFEDSKASPDVRQIWSDIVGLHRRQYEPVSQTDISRVQQVPPELWEGKQWWEHGIDQIGDRVFPDTQKTFKNYEAYVKYISDQRKDLQKRHKGDPNLSSLEQQIVNDANDLYPDVSGADPELKQKFKERMTWEKRFNGVTKSEYVRGIWQNLLGRPMPQHIQDYLQWRDKTKVSRKSKNAEFDFLLRRYLHAAQGYEQRLDNLASVRNSLSKVGSTKYLDSLISSVSREAFEDLLYMSSFV